MSLTKGGVGVAAIVALAAVSIGCIGFRGPADVKRGVERRTGSDLDREFAITVGPATMAFARWATRVADEPEGTAVLRGIRKVQVGVYVRDRSTTAVRLDRHLEPSDFPRYLPIVQVREDTDRVLVLAEMRGECMRRMLVVVDDLDEVVIVRLKGDLDRVIEEAIRLGLSEAERDDLADPTVETWREQNAADGAGERGA